MCLIKSACWGWRERDNFASNSSLKFFFFFFEVYLFILRGRERGRENPKQAPHCQHRAQRRAQTHKL